MDHAEVLTSRLANGADDFAVQLVQTRYRLRLLRTWPIGAGDRVLEVGCGQGDMTVALADAVGSSGRVTAVDAAGPDYGQPTTLGEAVRALRSGPLGDRLDIRLGVDLLSPAVDFEPDSFDVVVLAHCGWYFSSTGELAATLARIRPWARRLCLAEWSLTPTSFEQVPHLLAVLLQGQLEAVGVDGGGNVRTPVSEAGMARLVSAAGWRPTDRAEVDTRDLQDADWEIATALRLAATDRVAGRSLDLAAQQADVLAGLRRDRGNRPLPAYTLTAERN